MMLTGRPTYNTFLDKITKADLLIEITDGEARIIKNRRGHTEKFNTNDIVELIMHVFSIDLGIDFFTDAFKVDLGETFTELMVRHMPEGSGRDKKCTAIRKLWNPNRV